VLRSRILIDSTRLSVAVTPFARVGLRIGRTAKVAPEPPSIRPFQAGWKGATASRVNRALYGLREKNFSNLSGFSVDPNSERNSCRYWVDGNLSR
jgi:hypothetical protein